MFPYNYNPIPPRVWSRVENACAFNVTNVSENDLVYIPLTNQTVSPVQATQINQMIQKGNVLQYKKNSGNLTKKQKYSKIARGQWTSNKSYATQGYQYTNPNTTGLLRVNYTTFPNPNFIVGQPNNPSGPFQTNHPNPDNCPFDYILDGGSLVCNTYANPCSGEIIQTINNPLCFPTTCSDVPGPVQGLCWNPAIPTWNPRNKLTMNNSTDGWPNGYKGFVSAVYPATPTLTGTLNNDDVNYINGNTVFLNWNVQTTPCLPIVSWNVYENGNLILNIPYLTYTTINNLSANTAYTFYVVGIVSNTIQTQPSNNVTINTLPVVSPVITSILNDNNSINGNSVTLTLGSPANINVTSWNIYQNNILVLSNINSFTPTINNLMANSTYTFYAVGYNNNHETAPSNTISVTIPSPIPPTITGNYVINSSNNGYNILLNLSVPPNSNVTSWNIYQNNILILTNEKSLTPTINNVSSGTQSYYVVGYNNNIQTSPSNTISITIPIYLATGSYSYNYTNIINPNTGLNYQTVSFTGPGTIAFLTNSITVNTICVGGGGAGGNGGLDSIYSGGGGGGGGASIVNQKLSFTPNVTYDISIGGGGKSNASDYNGFWGVGSYVSLNSNIIIISYGGLGGESGSSYDGGGGNGGATGDGNPGGEGGNSYINTAQSGTLGGGGGGGGNNYGEYPLYGNGGNGSLNISVPIFGTSFGSGGGGGGSSFSSSVSGGSGGNSNAGSGGTIGKYASNGLPNTGSGGGGGSGNVESGAYIYGGSGGSGIIIFYW